MQTIVLNLLEKIQSFKWRSGNRVVNPAAKPLSGKKTDRRTKSRGNQATANLG